MRAASTRWAPNPRAVWESSATTGAAPKPPGSGIGLSNTRARLHELYGPKSALELANYPAGGTLVSLLIPLRRAQPEPAL
jgi:sensor histidine kinase YesM